MKRALIVIGIVIVILLGIGVVYSAAATGSATRTIDTKGITSLQVGDAHLKVVQDGQDKLVVRTSARAMPWVMARKTGGSLEIGYPGDADPRALLVGFGVKLPSDSLSFELHTTSLTAITLAGASSLEIARFDGPRLSVDSLTEKDSTLKGIFAKQFDVTMQGGGSITAEGAVDSLSVMDSGPGDFLGAKMFSNSQRLNPSGSGKIVTNVLGEGVQTFLGRP